MATIYRGGTQYPSSSAINDNEKTNKNTWSAEKVDNAINGALTDYDTSAEVDEKLENYDTSAEVTDKIDNALSNYTYSKKLNWRAYEDLKTAWEDNLTEFTNNGTYCIQAILKYGTPYTITYAKDTNCGIGYYTDYTDGNLKCFIIKNDTFTIRSESATKSDLENYIKTANLVQWVKFNSANTYQEVTFTFPSGIKKMISMDFVCVDDDRTFHIYQSSSFKDNQVKVKVQCSITGTSGIYCYYSYI